MGPKLYYTMRWRERLWTTMPTFRRYILPLSEGLSLHVSFGCIDHSVLKKKKKSKGRKIGDPSEHKFHSSLRKQCYASTATRRPSYFNPVERYGMCLRNVGFIADNHTVQQLLLDQTRPDFSPRNSCVIASR
jgi:hypothetical protein